ncbi:uncharacterized protein LOC114670304 [Macaca mulatta]
MCIWITWESCQNAASRCVMSSMAQCRGTQVLPSDCQGPIPPPSLTPGAPFKPGVNSEMEIVLLPDVLSILIRDVTYSSFITDVSSIIQDVRSSSLITDVHSVLVTDVYGVLIADVIYSVFVKDVLYRVPTGG